MKEERPKARILTYSLVVAVGFALLVAYVFIDKAGILYLFWVSPFAYIATSALLLGFVAQSRRRLVVMSSILLGALAAVAVTSAFTVPHGYPVSYQTYTTSCTNVQIPNATSPWGYTNSSECLTNPTTYTIAFFWNFLYWLPVSGLALFTMPTWRRTKSASEKAGYSVLGLLLIVALLLPLVGIPTVGL